MTIQTANLSSSAIASATYDDENEDLTITFRNGGAYDYHGVPAEIFQGLANASSPGRYWHANIKDQYS